MVYSTVQDDEVKRAYLLQSVYEPAMKFAPKKRKGVHKPGQNTTKKVCSYTNYCRPQLFPYKLSYLPCNVLLVSWRTGHGNKRGHGKQPTGASGEGVSLEVGAAAAGNGGVLLAVGAAVAGNGGVSLEVGGAAASNGGVLLAVGAAAASIGGVALEVGAAAAGNGGVLLAVCMGLKCNYQWFFGWWRMCSQWRVVSSAYADRWHIDGSATCACISVLGKRLRLYFRSHFAHREKLMSRAC